MVSMTMVISIVLQLSSCGGNCHESSICGGVDSVAMVNAVHSHAYCL